MRGLRAWGIVALLAMPSVQGHAQGTERSALRARLAADRVKTRFLKNEEASILQGLQGLEEGIETKTKTSQELTLQIESASKRIQVLTEGIVKNQAQLGDLRGQFGKRAAAMLRLRRARLSRMLRRIKDPNDVRRTRDRFSFVKNWDLKLIRGMLDATASDRKLRFELSEKKTKLSEDKTKLDTEVEDTADLKAERQALLQAIRKERVAAVRLAGELKDAARRLDAHMGKVMGGGLAPDALPGGFAAQKGHLPWPTVGGLEVPFGMKVDPESSMVLVAHGIDIRAAQSAPVRTVFGGKVVFTGSKAGFGRLAVVDHGGYYTLYAHLESFAAKRGQQVQPQQVIGYVGDTGSTKGAYLYFEIRKGREPVDPMRWLSR